MKLARDIMIPSTIKRDSGKILCQMKRTEEPIIPTVSGKAEVVVRDVDGYQKLQELKERAETAELLRQRLATLTRSKCRRLDTFFTEFFAKNSLTAEDH